MSLSKLQKVPGKSLVLLAGPPGAGKSAFCHQVVLNALAMDRPVIYATTEQGPGEIIGLLRRKGMVELAPEGLSFIDAFGDTVGVAIRERPDTVFANCEDLNSISMAIGRQQERIGRTDVLLAFDSLTSPYLFNKEELFRFLRLCLLKFAVEGNSVLALMDEGCGRPEDLTAMMSIADGVIKVEVADDRQLLSVVKHPQLRPATIEVVTEPEQVELTDVEMPFTDIDPASGRRFAQSVSGQDTAALRREAGDFVNLFWPNLAHWSGMLWDPRRFPTMIYNLNKQDGLRATDFMRQFGPWYLRLLFKLEVPLTALGFFPRSLSSVRDMKKMWRALGDTPYMERSGVVEYLDEVSGTDEHYFRVYESADCSGFEGVGAAMASHLPVEMAGWFQAGERDRRNWNALEIKCVGMGDPYCEFKLVAGEIDELRGSLEKESSANERIHDRLMERPVGFMIDGEPLVDRPRLGSDVHLHPVMHAFGFPNVAGARYRMALRMGGAKTGK